MELYHFDKIMNYPIATFVEVVKKHPRLEPLAEKLDHVNNHNKAPSIFAIVIANLALVLNDYLEVRTKKQIIIILTRSLGKSTKSFDNLFKEKLYTFVVITISLIIYHHTRH